MLAVLAELVLSLEVGWLVGLLGWAERGVVELWSKIMTAPKGSRSAEKSLGIKE